MSKLNFVTLDVFTDTRFKGNSLAISQIPKQSKTGTRSQAGQAIASELHLSETVFLHPGNDESTRKIGIDIFTTSTEIPFAGDADQRHNIFFGQIGSHHQILWIDSLFTQKRGPVSASFNHGARFEQQQIFRTIMSSFIRHPVAGSTIHRSTAAFSNLLQDQTGEEVQGKSTGVGMDSTTGNDGICCRIPF